MFMAKILYYNLLKYKYKPAFTLAEILVTLTILGVVAAMVIPSLINSINNEKLVVALKKSYSSLSYATQMIMAENGGTMKGFCADSDNTCARDAFTKYIKEMKKCESGSYLGKCWHENSGEHISKYLNGAVITTWGSGDVAAITADGAFMKFSYTHNNCDGNVVPHPLNNDISCTQITLDTNGFTPPNIVGKDIFRFAVIENKVVPLGSELDAASCTGVGWGCASKVLTEGVINY